MIRVTAPRPPSFNLTQLAAEANATYPGCLDVNEVDPDLVAAYWESSAPTEQQWTAVVAAHVPTPPVPPEPTAEERLATLIAALTDAQSLEEIRDAAAAAGGTP